MNVEQDSNKKSPPEHLAHLVKRFPMKKSNEILVNYSLCSTEGYVPNPVRECVLRHFGVIQSRIWYIVNKEDRSIYGKRNTWWDVKIFTMPMSLNLFDVPK